MNYARLSFRLSVLPHLACLAVVMSMTACTDTPAPGFEPELPAVPVIDTQRFSKEVQERFAVIQQKLDSTPLDGHYNARYGRLLHAYSLYAPAATMYQRCRELRPSDLDCIYLESLIQRQLGNSAVAIDLLAALLERKPDYPRARVVLASSYREQGQIDLALPLFEQVVANDRGDLEAAYGLAMSVMEQGDNVRARSLLEGLHKDGRQFGIVHAALATISRQEGDPDAAAFHAAAARRFNSRKIPYVDSVLWAVQDEQVGDQRHVRDARAHFKAGRLAEAADAYYKSTLINPNNGNSHASLVGIYGELGNLAAALRHYEKARAINPMDVLPLMSLGTVHMKRGQFAAARTLFAEVVSMQPENAEARTLNAYCAELLGEPSQPDEFRRALVDDPTQSLAHYLLARHLIATQGCSEALPHLRDSIRLESARTPAFMSDVVRCLVEGGEYGEARAVLESGQALARYYNNRGAQQALDQTSRDLADQLQDEGSP